MLYTITCTVLMIVIMSITSIMIGHRQEDAKLVGKLKHSIAVITLDQVAFIGLIATISSVYWTIFAALLLLCITLPLYHIPYNGKYNIRFASGYRFVTTIKSLLLVGVFITWLVGLCI